MPPKRSTGTALIVPTLGCAVVSAAGALVAFQSVPAAVFAGGACLACGGVHLFLVGRWQQAAGARLRRPELRTAPASGTGVYRRLLQEALALLEPLEQEAEEASRLRIQQEARAKVRQQQTRRLESALDCLHQPVVITGAREQVHFCNAAARRLLETAAPETPGATRPPSRSAGANPSGDSQFANSIPTPARLPALARLIEETRTRNAATDQRNCEFDVESGGDVVSYRATATHIADGAGGLLGVITVIQDIGHERREKTRHAEFVSSVCHELKTPMASIRGFIEMLIDGDIEDPDEQRELYGFIDEQVDRLTRLANNMLNLSRIESGVVKVQREDCELNEVLEQAISVVRPTADEKQIRVVSELSDLYMAVHVDSDVFGQAVINLLSNAVKYTPAGGEVRLRSRMSEDEAVIEVRDTGMGIPADSLPRIFERFYRVPENNKAAAGTGLGLALVHYIVTELHNGAIEVESAVGVGSCFTVKLPLGHRDPNHKRIQAPLEAVLCEV